MMVVTDEREPPPDGEEVAHALELRTLPNDELDVGRGSTEAP